MRVTSRREEVKGDLIGFSALAGIIMLIISGILIIIPLHENLWKMIDPSFSEVSPCNVGLTEEILKPGDIAECVTTGSSLEGEWYLKNVEFIPDDSSLGVWQGNDAGEPIIGSGKKSSNKESFTVSVTFQIPEDSSLEGKTVSGTLKGVLVYPIQWGIEWKITNRIIEKSLDIRIFSPQEAETYTALTERFNSVCLNTWLIFFVGGLLLFGIAVVIALRETNKK